jgi:transposase
MAIIGMDIHRTFAEAVAVEGKTRRRLGRIDLRRDRLAAFATGLNKDDIIVVEATGNAAAVAEVLAPHVGRVVIANPKQVHLIARAKIKTDKIDAAVLAQLYASGFLPEVWMADDVTQALRRQVTRRNQIVRQRTRLKNIIQSILHAHLIPACPAANLFGRKGRIWLSAQHIPEDERQAIERHMREIDRLGEDLKVIQSDLAQHALGDLRVARLMTIPGLDIIVTMAVLAAIGDIRRFASPRQLVSYFGLNPSVRQSGSARAYHGRAYDYNIKPVRDRERQEVEQAEKLYERFVAGWNPRGPKVRMSAARGGATTEAARQGSHLQPCSSPRGRPCASPA